MSLPYDAEVEFLESIGTQWINTGINCNSNYILEVEAQGAKSSEGILGARKSGDKSAHTLVYPNDGGTIRYTSGGTDSNIFGNVNISLYNIYKADYNKLYINDALVGTSSRTVAFTLNIRTICLRLTPMEVYQTLVPRRLRCVGYGMEIHYC